MTVFDAFSYWRNSERWAIDARRHLWQTLAPTIPYVMVACVGDRTHRGNPLPDGPPEVPDWVERVDVTLDGPSDWHRDEQQRDAIWAHLHWRIGPDDLVIISDTDEIVDPRMLGTLQELAQAYMYVRIGMHLWMCGTTWRNEHPWDQTLIMRGEHLPENVSKIRRDMAYGVTSPVAGWHLSYFGSDEFIDQKLRAYAHAEFDTEETRETLRQMRDHGASHLILDPLAGPLADFLNGRMDGVQESVELTS